MQVVIIRDGGATKIPREVADMDAVEALREQGHEVELVAVAADDLAGDELAQKTAPKKPARAKAA